MAEIAADAPQRVARRPRLRGAALLGTVPFFAYVTIFLVIPTLTVVIGAFTGDGGRGFTLANVSALGDEYIVASESVALDILGFERLRDVAPGEGIVITARGELFAQQCAPRQAHAPCIFEYVYFARPDSMIEEISVHKARMRMGVTLGEKILRERPDHDIDVVIPIPDTSRDSALEIANVLGAEGALWLLDATEGLPLRVFAMAPSCVPASALESPRGALNVADMARILEHERAIGVAEVMDFPSVIAGDPDVLAKVALHPHVDGHAPGVAGRELSAYAATGIASGWTTLS